MTENDQLSRATYLVGGFRISIGPRSTTPGPRTHIVGFTDALRRQGVDVRTILASQFPGMGRFSRLKQTDYQSASMGKVIAADFVRIAAGAWSGVNVLVRGLATPAELIYERVAVFQSLSSFHPYKGRAFRVVEANGVLARETARDRKVLKLEGFATWMERRTLRRADLVVAVSAALADELVRYAGLEPTKILVLPNGANPATIALADRSVPSAPIIGFVGSVVAWHRLDGLLQAICQLRTESPTLMEGVRLEIIGEGPELPRLMAISRAEGLKDCVEFLGSLPHDAALERMQRWSVGFAGHEKSSSSVMYHSPLKLYEYAALGLVIACTPSADADAISSAGGDVFIYDPTDVVGVTGAVRAAVTAAKADTPGMREIRRRSMRDQHSWDARARKLLGTVAERRRR